MRFTLSHPTGYGNAPTHASLQGMGDYAPQSGRKIKIPEALISGESYYFLLTLQ